MPETEVGKGREGVLQVLFSFCCQSLTGTSLWLSQSRIRLQCKRHGRPGFNPCVRKILWSRKVVTQSSILAWKIPWTEEPGGLQSIGSQRVGHDWRDLACMHINSRVLVIILWVIIWYYIIYPVAQIDSALAFGSSFSWLLHPSDLSLWVLSFWHFLPLCIFIYKILQAHLIYFLHQP